MQCQKCSKAAVVHLTDMVMGSDGQKRPAEIHLCLEHAVETGAVGLGTEIVEKFSNVEPPVAKKKLKPVGPAKKPAATPPGALAKPEPTAIVPAAATPPGGLSIVRKEQPPAPGDAQTCPLCGITWGQFKQSGLMGCPNDYAYFEPRLLSLVKRAQENATQHAGKVPTHMRQSDPVRMVTAARLRRELEHALEVENYEQAAKLRDQIKGMDGTGT